MQNVLADLALESESATALFMRVARSVDEAESSPDAAALRRIGTALAKYYVCKRTPAVVAEALESLGGNGYVEESIMPRLYREAPLNSIWEGSGNINALDVLRILRKQPEALAAWRAEIEPVRNEARFARVVGEVERDLLSLEEFPEARARSLSERMAVLWQAALLAQHAPAFVADAFVSNRLGDRSCSAFGTLAAGTPLRDIVERAAPAGVEAVTV
jgi:putative acyl-CoA dehydrogenase